MLPATPLVDVSVQADSAQEKDDRTTGHRSESAREVGEDLVQFTVHETRKLNAQIKRFSEELLLGLERDAVDVTLAQRRAHNIFAASSLISSRLNAYDFHVNPAAASAAGRASVGIYKKFEKSVQCLRPFATDVGLTITLTGSSYREIAAYPILEVLPFVMIENAVKYSPRGEDVVVNFSEEGERIIAKVISIGPRLDDDERARVSERGFRGRHAMAATTTGTGFGLYLASLIAELHGWTIEAHSEDFVRDVQRVPYHRFVVKITMQ